VRDYYAAGAAFRARQVAQTTKNWESNWEHWRSYVKPLGVDPYLQATLFQQRVQYLSGFASRVQSGYYGKGKQVQASTVSSAITAVGQKITLDTNNNPTKVTGLDKFLTGLQINLDGYRTKDPPTEKKLLVEANVPELLIDMGYGPSGSTLGQAVRDSTLIAFYYLLRVGECTVKGTHNEL
jgi:hypothetical protein